MKKKYKIFNKLFWIWKEKNYDTKAYDFKHVYSLKNYLNVKEQMNKTLGNLLLRGIVLSALSLTIRSQLHLMNKWRY